MRRLACWTLVALSLALTSCAAAWAASASSPPQASSPGMKDFQQNLTVGSELMERQGTPEQLGALQKLYTRGVKDAREAAIKNPKSPEAQHMLGSWLLYAYRVVMSKRITHDAKGDEHIEEVPVAVHGYSSDQAEGLKAMQRAQDLAPRSGHYVVEYGAALLHCNRNEEASTVLKKAWGGDVQTPVQDKVRAAMLLSDLAANRGDAPNARGWLYRALAENRDNIGIVERLRKLDSRQASAAVTAPAGEEESGVSEDTSGAESDQSVAPDENSGADVSSEDQSSTDDTPVIEAPESNAAPSASDDSSSSASDGSAGSASDDSSAGASDESSQDEQAPAAPEEDSGD